MQKEDKRKIAFVSLFAVAMGLLEAAVVVYLRAIYYPNGFDFPLAFFTGLLNVEWAREFATIVMLVCIGLIVGKKFNEKLAYFLLSFAVWDISYYVFLKIFLGWPASLMTWDLLFLIPWPWASPMIAPVICSLIMIAFSFALIQRKDRKISLNEWRLTIIGALIILYTFLYDYGLLIISKGFLPELFNLAANQGFIILVESYVPASYNWGLFFIGEFLILWGIIHFYGRKR